MCIHCSSVSEAQYAEVFPLAGLNILYPHASLQVSQLLVEGSYSAFLCRLALSAGDSTTLAVSQVTNT